MYSRLLLRTAILWMACVSSPVPETAAVPSASTADSLSLHIASLRSEGRYAEALNVAHRLLEVNRHDATAGSWEIEETERLLSTLEFIVGLPEDARCEMAEADRLSADIARRSHEGNYGAAADLAERQLDIRRRHLGNRHLEVVAIRDELATMLGKQGYDKEAEDMYRNVLALRQDLLGPEHPEVARSLHYLGTVLWKLGDYPQAERLLREALDMRRRLLGERHEDVGKSLNNLALLSHSQGDFAQAEVFFREALTLVRDSLGEENPATIKALSNLALILSRQGNHAASEPLLRKVLALRRRVYGNEHAYVALSLGALAQELCKKGDFGAAEPLYREALAMRLRLIGEEDESIASNLINLADALYSGGELDSADVLCRRGVDMARRIQGEDSRLVAGGVGQLAEILDDRGESAESGWAYREALAISRRALGEDHPDVGLTLHGLASHLMREGRLAEAKTLFEDALVVQRKHLGDESPRVAWAQLNLASCVLAEGNLKAAEGLLVQAAEGYESARLRAGAGFTRVTYVESPYWKLAAARCEMGNTSGAWPAMEKALGRALADQMLASGRRHLTRDEVARESTMKKTLAQLERRVPILEKACREDSPEETLAMYEDARTRLLEAEAAWGAFQHEVELKHPVSEGRAFPLDRIRAALDTQTAIVGWLSVETGPTTLVCWGYVIRESGPVHWVRLVSRPADGIVSASDRARDFRETLVTTGSWPFRVTDVARVTADAHELWTSWMAPLVPHLERAENLVVIPLGPLLGIPVEAFVDHDGVSVGETYAVSYVPSATIHTWLRERSRAPRESVSGKALLVGDPPFSAEHAVAMETEEEGAAFPLDLALASRASSIDVRILRSALAGNAEALSSLPRLAKTREEVRRISSVISSPTTLLGPRASEQEIVRLAQSGDIRRFDTIHLATHALTDDERPERSAIILSQVNLPDPLEAAMTGKRIFDGVLTMSEIVREWDLDADLVTLSGCRTGLGREAEGEGYVGLAYALLQAGARSLVVSLWKVDDEATSLLMSRFYENLFGTFPEDRGRGEGRPLPKAHALQEARQWLRLYKDANGNCPFRHPAYWSGFVLIGDPG